MKRPINEVIIDLDIPASEYLRYYKGDASAVQTRARDGRSVRFPASLLRAFVDDGGVRGCFVLRYDGNHRLVSLSRAGEGR